MLHRILHERLDDHRRHPGATDVVGQVHVYGQPRAEARALDVKVGAHELDFIVEQRPFAFGAPQGVAEHVGQLLDRAVRDDWILVDEAGDGVERVEEEMRVDLRAKSPQLRSACVQR